MRRSIVIKRTAAFVVALMAIAVWAVRSPRGTSDYGTSDCNSSPEIFSVPQQTQMNDVTVISEEICDANEGVFGADPTKSCSTNLHDFIYKIIVPAKNPKVVTAVSITSPLGAVTADFGLITCNGGPPGILCSNTSALSNCVSNAPDSRTGMPLTWTFPCSGNAFNAGHDLTFYVATDPSNAPRVSISTSQTTASPAIQLSPSQLFYGPQAIGTTSSAQSVTVHNYGNASATLNVTASGNFVISSKSCGSTLAAGAQCSASITFHPTVAGPRLGSLSVSANESDSPRTTALVGNGLYKLVSLPELYGNGLQPSGLVAADFDKDSNSNLDLVLAGCPGYVGVQFGNGDGSFQPPVFYQTGAAGCASIINRDFNNDKYSDLVTGNGDGSVSLLLNGGVAAPGTFTLGANSPVSFGRFVDRITGIDAGYIDADTNLDVVAADPADGITAGTVTVLLGDGHGNLTAQSPVFRSTAQPYAVAVADLNHDQKADIVVANFATSQIAVLISKGSGLFNAPVFYNVGKNPVALQATDFSGDKNIDIAVANRGSNTVSILLGNGGRGRGTAGHSPDSFLSHECRAITPALTGRFSEHFVDRDCGLAEARNWGAYQGSLPQEGSCHWPAEEHAKLAVFLYP